MADETTGDAADARTGRTVTPELLTLEEFIFVRELYEVFLLLDHVSGRWDKGLHVSGAQPSPPIIETVCAIGLAPAEDPAKRLKQAVDLMYAKDALNAIARPATGLTVAFTILVVGEENRRKPVNKMRRICRDLFRRDAPPDGDTAAARRGVVDPTRGMPTRVTLARYAYPGLIGVAIRFNRRMILLVAVLLFALGLTCLLSWHVAAGNVILQHLEDVRARTAEVRKEIAAAELKYANDERVDAGLQGKALPPRAVRFCTLGTAAAPLYRTTEEYHLCRRQESLQAERRAVRLNLREWLAPWKTTYKLLGTSTYYLDRWLTPAPVARKGAASAPAPVEATDPDEAPASETVRRRGHEEKARIVTPVVGTAVLPLAYGVLGAGAAVVRRLWERMRESTLSPRDATLALLQLALGGTIGACIALFINPSGPAPAEEHGLLGTWALSGSALSFIAGFGVEGVFRALEAFVHRVFGVQDAPPKPPAQGGAG